MPVVFNYKIDWGTNVAGDFAYDIFFRHDTQKTKPQLEVMIWGDHNSWPIGQKTASNVINAAGRTFDLWEGMNDSAGYYVFSFVPRDTVGKTALARKGQLNLDVKQFLNWLQANRASQGKYNNNMFLHAIEAGFEVVNGRGKVSFSATFDVY